MPERDLGVATEILKTAMEDGKTVALRKRGDVYEVILGNVVLLSSAALETELEFGRLAKVALTPCSQRFDESKVALAPGSQRFDESKVALTPFSPFSPPRVLVGGLGFGATLRGALEVTPPDAEVLVAEKLRTVVGFARNEVAHLTNGALEDPRTRLLEEDVGDVIARERGLDAILLDVDNGPEWASFRSNARLYAPQALAEAKRALRPGGIFAVWSGYPKDVFVKQLRSAGFQQEIIALREGATVRARAYVGRVV